MATGRNQMDIDGRPAGRRALPMITALVLALLMIGLAQSGPVSAKDFKGHVSVSQHEYVQICKDTGGSPSRAGSRKVKCDYGDGYSSTCNFKTNTCVDTIPMIVTPQDSTAVVTTGTLAVDPGTDQAQPEIVQPLNTGAIAPLRGHDASALDPLGQ